MSGLVLVEASAGTGKTFKLEEVAVELVRDGGLDPSEILVVTFTEKATEELVGRLRARFEAMIAPGDGAPQGKALAALHGFDRMTIATIHAFCQRVLAEFAFAGGRLFAEAQVDARDAFAAAFVETLREDIAGDAEARHALTSALGAGLRLGQVEDLLFRCHGERGELRPVFDPAAARAALASCPPLGELRANLETLMVQGRLNASKRRAVLDRLGRIEPLLASFAAEGDLLRLLHRVDLARREHPAPRELFGYVTEHLAGLGAHELADCLRALSDTLVPLKAALVARLLPRVRARLAQRKREAGLLDFDDMIAAVDDALAGPRGEDLTRALRARYKVALIDEFQDTDDLQWSIFGKLFPRAHLIGDPKQAIYSFRGADVFTYLRAKEEALAAGASVVVLDRNFRSTPRLIAAYNAILDQKAPAPLFTGRIRYDDPVKAGDPLLVAVDAKGREVPPVKVLDVPPEEGRTVREVMGLLARRIAQEIRALLSEPAPLRFGPRGSEAPLRAGDVFVLTRTIAEGFDIAEALARARIPHAFYKQDGLFQSEEARHVRDVLAALADPSDRSKRLKAWLTPFFAVPLDELGRCRDLPVDHPLVARLAAWRSLAERGRTRRLLARMVEESGIRRRLLMLAEGQRALVNYEHVLEVMLLHAETTGAGVGELAAELDAFVAGRREPPGEDPNVQRDEGDRQAVQIMTMHKAKGLEAAVVFLAGGFTRPVVGDVAVLHEGSKRLAWVGPLSGEAAARAAREEAEENQRLLYVALTRAKARLYLPLFGACARADATAGAGRPARSSFMPDGAYRPLNDRLLGVVATPELVDPLFEREVVRSTPITPLASGARAEALRAWRPADELLRAEVTPFSYAELREARRGPFVASYSQLRTGKKEEVRFEATEPAGDLAGGRSAGTMLHEVLARVDLSLTKVAPSFDDWARSDAVQELFGGLVRRHDLDEAAARQALELVHASLTSPLPIGVLTLRGGVASLERVLREVEFACPAGKNGYVRGYLDLYFELEGRGFIVDWKSDRLPRYDAPTMRDHVDRHYALQSEVYALGAARMLGVTTREDYEARFGGFAFAFLRAAGKGDWVDFRRPSWDQVLECEASIARGEAR